MALIINVASFGTSLLTRSEARTLLGTKSSSYTKKLVVILDFQGVTCIGQGFSNELLKLCPVNTIPINMTKQVDKVLQRAIVFSNYEKSVKSSKQKQEKYHAHPAK